MILQPLVDTVRASLHTLTSNKLRSALTLLGIVIGVFAVVVMAATVEGLRRSINSDLAQLGSAVFQVQRQPMNGGFNNGHNFRKYERRKPFTLADVELLEAKCQECLHVAGEAWTGGQTVSGPAGAASPQTQVVGGTPYFFENNGYGLANGRLFSEGEVGRAADVIVLGADLVDSLFAGRNPLGGTVHLKGQAYRVIGTLDRRGSSMGGSMDAIAVIPVTRFLLLFGQRQSLNVTIMARDTERMAYAQDEVVALLRRARAVPPQDENDFEMFSNASAQEDFQSLASKISVVTIGVCAIALLIGGIGVLNIMLVSVTERTSEIGVRRALGARRRRILAQFIIEAVVLCAAGGAIGIGLGWLAAFLVKVLWAVPTLVPAWAVAVSLIASSTVGLVFGSYPAWRASRLDPVEAMRHE